LGCVPPERTAFESEVKMRSLLTRFKFVSCMVVGVWMLASTSSRAQQPVAEPAPAPDTPAGLPSEPQASAPPMPEPEPVRVKTPIEVEVGGGMILWYYQPLQDPDSGPAKNNFEIFEARLRLDARFGRYKVHITPRFRDTKERAFFPGEGWVEEAYAAALLGPVTVKLGKVYAHFGKFWDNSWYGNAQQYDGLKLDLNHGVSVEGVFNENEPFGLNYWVQYFIIDGTTSYAQPNRDTQAQLAIPGAHRRNQFFVRAEPVIQLGTDMKLTLGASAMYARADIPTLPNEDVGRVAADATFTSGGLAAWAEYSQQFGRHVANFPAPGVSSNDNRYVMLGVEYTYDWLTARYNFNYGDYHEVDYTETRHIPGVAAVLDDHLTLLLELVFANATLGDDSILLDNSLNLTVQINF
jgi:hypothetical protein